MKLGIVVVYLVKPDDGSLLELHLSQIARNTTVPYRLYAATERLLPALVSRLREFPQACLCPCEPTELRGARENTHYLEQLVRFALEDGVTHICALHPDSFPVRPGWAEAMVDLCAPDGAVCAIQRVENHDLKPQTCGLLFSSDWYLRYRPGFLLTAEQRASEQYKRYQAAVPHIADSGSGFGFSLWCAGLQWAPLNRSNRAQDHALLGSVYGDLIFHLGAASHERFTLNLDGRINRWTARTLRGFWDQGRHVLYGRAQEERRNAAAYARIREALLRDPEGYLHYLRSGTALRTPRTVD